MGKEFLRRFVTGWEGPITDGEGKPAAFDEALLFGLPQNVQLAVADVVSTNVDGKHVEVDPS